MFKYWKKAKCRSLSFVYPEKLRSMAKANAFKEHRQGQGQPFGYLGPVLYDIGEVA